MLLARVCLSPFRNGIFQQDRGWGNVYAVAFSVTEMIPIYTILNKP